MRGSGPNGRITRDDVQGFVKTALAGGAGTAPGARAAASGGFGLGLPPWPSIDFAKFGPVERVALSRIQRISGPVLARNWVMIPHVTQNDDADVTELEAFRKAVNGERKDVKVTMLAFLMKAAVAALKRFPQVNASLDGDELVLKKYYHLGFAADTPNGLLVPVIRDVDQKGLVELARRDRRSSPRKRATGSSDRTRSAARRSRSARWDRSGGPISRRSSTRRKSRSWAPAKPSCARCGTARRSCRA